MAISNRMPFGSRSRGYGTSGSRPRRYSDYERIEWVVSIHDILLHCIFFFLQGINLRFVSLVRRYLHYNSYLSFGNSRV